MSDIAIRFDGLLLAAAISFSALVFALIAALSLILATVGRPRKSHRLGRAKSAGAMTGFSLICLAVLLAYMEAGSLAMSSSDWIDWIALPWTILFLLGLIGLFRRRKGAGEIS